MISTIDRESIISIAKKYKVSRILLFGSSALDHEVARDIDLAVEGISPTDFFPFYSELIFKLTKPVDIIDLAGNSRFHRMVASEGIPIYG
jgi:predicted nucleotidyltransferase